MYFNLTTQNDKTNLTLVGTDGHRLAKFNHQLKENIGSIDVTLNQDTLDKINLIHNNNPNPAP